MIEAVVVETLETAPPDATHWSTRGLAKKPWRSDAFKVSPDPELVERSETWWGCT